MYLLYFCITTLIFLSINNTINGASFFDSNGHLSQVDSALKAATNGGNILAIKNDNKKKVIAVLWSPIKPGIDMDDDENNNNNIQKLSNQLLLCGAGVAADVSFLRNRIFDDVLSHRYLYNTESIIDRLAATTASYMHESTLSMRHRPFGARILFLGLDESPLSSIPRARLLELDPIGNCHDCLLTCIGPYTEHIMEAINGYAGHDDRNRNRNNSDDDKQKDHINMKGRDILSLLYNNKVENHDEDKEDFDLEDEMKCISLVLDVMQDQGVDRDEARKQITVVKVDENGAGPLSKNDLNRIFQRIPGL